MTALVVIAMGTVFDFPQEVVENNSVVINFIHPQTDLVSESLLVGIIPNC